MLQFNHFRGDLFGGLTAAIVALPLALAFGVGSGMGAIAGLYGAIALGIFAALFGGTKTQISGPTGPMTVVAATVIAAQIAHFGTLEAALPSILATFILAGLLQIFMGVIRIGTYIKYMPYPVISGFMSGIGVIIIILQIFPFAGLEAPKGIIETLKSLDQVFTGFNPAAVFLALGTIATIYLFPKVTKAVPSTLVALILFTLVAYFLELDVAVIGEIPTGLPTLHLDSLVPTNWHDPMLIVVSAITLSALGAIDSLLTSVVADNMTKTQHQSNKELIGQGIGNSIAGLIGGLPGAGATMRTVVNINSGGKTKLSGFVHGVILLLVLIGAGVYAKVIPLSVLAGILITVGIGIIDYKGLKDIRYIPRSDAVIMIVVLLLTVLVDLLQAVAAGMVMASLWFMKQMSENAHANAKGKLHTPSCEEMGKKVYMQHFEGPIFFGFTFGFKEIVREMPEVEAVVFNMLDVPYIDQSGLYVMEETIISLRQKGIDVYFFGMQTQPKDMFEKVKLIPNLVEKENLYDDFTAFSKAVKI
ncbi:SulP family inorganic anion transporter [Sulfurimonas marina]|uniref:SulP family inorganic anion transporter n=1 Tax=Sulfurimonas marina TaxID=2590551 RepID=A0A7M1AWF0_9BACT|nr:SulP family inorganic anion transporter [Sulfurimonas marina]QOP41787.1 SulP family inorganic anion transporter [Sulfurimonas marina]